MYELIKSFEEIKNYCRRCNGKCPHDCIFYDEYDNDCLMIASDINNLRNLIEEEWTIEIPQNIANAIDIISENCTNRSSDYCDDIIDIGSVIIEYPCEWIMGDIKKWISYSKYMKKLINGVKILNGYCRRCAGECPNDCQCYDVRDDTCLLSYHRPDIWVDIISLHYNGIADNIIGKSITTISNHCKNCSALCIKSNHRRYCEFFDDVKHACIFETYLNELSVYELQRCIWR